MRDPTSQRDLRMEGEIEDSFWIDYKIGHTQELDCCERHVIVEMSSRRVDPVV